MAVFLIISFLGGLIRGSYTIPVPLTGGLISEITQEGTTQFFKNGKLSYVGQVFTKIPSDSNVYETNFTVSGEWFADGKALIWTLVGFTSDNPKFKLTLGATSKLDILSIQQDNIRVSSINLTDEPVVFDMIRQTHHMNTLTNTSIDVLQRLEGEELDKRARVGTINDRVKLAKQQSVDYDIPSSATAVIKMLTYPFLNNVDKYKHQEFTETAHAFSSTVSPIKGVQSDYIYDGGDCRVGMEATSVDRQKNIVVLEIVGITCIDNRGIAFHHEDEEYLGFVSEIDQPGVPGVSIVEDDNYQSIDVNKNYLMQLYSPIEKMKEVGISVVGRY